MIIFSVKFINSDFLFISSQLIEIFTISLFSLFFKCKTKSSLKQITSSSFIILFSNRYSSPSLSNNISEFILPCFEHEVKINERINKIRIFFISIFFLDCLSLIGSGNFSICSSKTFSAVSALEYSIKAISAFPYFPVIDFNTYDIDDEVACKYFEIALDNIRENNKGEDKKNNRIKRLSLDEKFNNLYTNDYIIEEDITLYAGWYDPVVKGEKNTNNIFPNVKKDFTFTVISDVKLTNNNIKQYIFIEDVNGYNPSIYIKERNLNEYIIASDEYMKILDKNLAHIQITVTSTDDKTALTYEQATISSERIKAIEKLSANGCGIRNCYATHGENKR